MNYEEIPEEILLKIFSYLTTKDISKSLAPVCTKWWTISRDPSLWKRLELNISAGKSPNVYRQVITRWEASLVSLTLSTPTMSDGLYLNRYFSNLKLPNLKELVLSGWWYIVNSELLDVVSNCPNVEILNLRVGGSSGLHHISKLKNLKSLTISDHVPRPDLELVVKNCTKLEALILRTLVSFDEEILVELAEYRKETLKHLVLNRDILSNCSIRAITSCHNLSTLRLYSIGFPLTRDMLSSLSRLQNLNWLDLGAAMKSEPQAWKNFFKCSNLSSLTILELSGCDLDDNDVISLAMTCKKLVILDLSENCEVRNAGVQSVIDNCRQLYYFDLEGTQVTGDILSSIPTKLPKLKYLNVQDCSGIGDYVLKKFTLVCPRIQFTNKFDDSHVEYTVDERLNLKWESWTYAYF